MRLKYLDQLGKIGKRSGQAVDLVDHHDIDLAGANVDKQGLQSRTLQGTAGQPAVVIADPEQSPALLGLALDVGLCRLALGVERVEVLLEPCSDDFLV